MSTLDHKTIFLPQNYILVKPDGDFKHYHNSEGKETSILAATSLRIAADPNSETDFSEKEIVDTYSHNMSYTGTVIAVPQKLNFTGEEARKFYKENKDGLQDQLKAMKVLGKYNQIKEDSVEYKVKMDVEIGDKVMYDYLERFNVYESGLVLETDIGELFLIKYDKLELRIRGEEIKPLNSWVLMEYDRTREISSGNLVLQGVDKRIEETVGVHSSKILMMADPSEDYLGDNDFYDPIHELNIGEEVFYLPQHASNVENDNHFFLFSGKEIIKIKSHNILACRN